MTDEFKKRPAAGPTIGELRQMEPEERPASAKGDKTWTPAWFKVQCWRCGTFMGWFWRWNRKESPPKYGYSCKPCYDKRPKG